MSVLQRLMIRFFLFLYQWEGIFIPVLANERPVLGHSWTPRPHFVWQWFGKSRIEQKWQKCGEECQDNSIQDNFRPHHVNTGLGQRLTNQRPRMTTNWPIRGQTAGASGTFWSVPIFKVTSHMEWCAIVLSRQLRVGSHITQTFIDSTWGAGESKIRFVPKYKRFSPQSQ